MKYQLVSKHFYFFASLTFLLYLNGCRDLGPESEILDLYTSPKINAYKIQRIALMPMAQDDTTDSGTFYSTNHFFNSLKQNYPDMKFVIPAIEVSGEYDTLIPGFVESIEKLKRLNLKNFFRTQVGSSVDEENPDAILIGSVDKRTPKTGYALRSYAFINVISCEFRYFLISLVDGRVLWKADVLGEEGYYVSHRRELFPPLDLALANGIDKIIFSLPFTKNSEQNNQQEK